MSDKPALFSTPMVHCILKDLKTQTSRPMVPQDPRNSNPRWGVGDDLWVKETWSGQDFALCSRDNMPCYMDKTGQHHPVVFKAGTEDYAWGLYGPPKWKSGRFMQKISARIWLKVTGFTGMQLQDLSEDQIRAEGIFPTELRITSNNRNPVVWSWEAYPTPLIYDTPQAAMKALWDRIYIGLLQYDHNPWIWHYTFQKKLVLK